ncbi:MAG: DUF2905 domain-containing protein [Gemmatimonadota bacterium]
MSKKTFGSFLLALGIAAIVIGLAIWLGAFRWFGHLPGDIHAVQDGVQIYIPFTSLVVVAILLSVVVQLLQRWLR